MILIISCSIPLSWEVERAQARLRAVTAIKEIGGLVLYDHDHLSESSLYNYILEFNRFIRGIIGRNYFDNVESVRILDPLTKLSFNDCMLANLENFTHLKELKVAYCPITDGGMVHLEHLTQLQVLNLSGTFVGDRGLIHLKGLRKLRELRLANTKVTEAGIVHLKDMSQLQVLNLNGTAINDHALVHLKVLENLRELHVSNTMVTDAGLMQLRHIKRLVVIHQPPPTRRPGVTY
jgi:hypothetical protein